jgi:transposase
MTRPLSNDLRERVVAATLAGEICRTVATRFGVAVSSVVKGAQRHRATGSVAPTRMGGRRKRMLEPHGAFIVERINQTSHLTLHGLKDELAARGVHVSHNSVWLFLRREGLLFKKKRCSPLNRPAPTSHAGASDGAHRRPALIRDDRRDLDQDQHDAAARLGAKRQTAARLCSARSLAHADLSGRAAL